MHIFNRTITSKHLLWAFVIVMWSTFFGWGYYDREKPLTFLGSAMPATPAGKVGEELMFDYYVERHLGRKCSMVLTRWVVDSTHAKRKYTEDDEFVSADGREERQKDFPGRLRIPITIPKQPAGPARVLTETQWRCPFNLTTYIVPITMSYYWDFYVLPSSPSEAASSGRQGE